MAESPEIQRLLNLINQKINILNSSLDALEGKEVIAEYVGSMQPLLNSLGKINLTYCEIEVCNPYTPKTFPSIPDVARPEKAPPPVFPPENIEEIIGALVIEAMYIEGQDIGLLPASYQNIAVGSGHVCNNAKFAVYANDVFIGDVNLNNDTTGQASPYDNQMNTPSALTGGTWTGSSSARYSRLDITQNQASQMIENNNSTIIHIKLTAYSPNPHTNITWLRVSRKVGNQLDIVQDVLVSLNQNYDVDVSVGVE